MAYFVYIASLLAFFSVSAVKVEPTESSNNSTAPSIKFSGSYDPLKKPKSPYARVMRESNIGSCESGEANPVFPVKGKVAS